MPTSARTVIYLLTSYLLIPGVSFSQKNYKVVYRHCVENDTTQVIRDTLGREAILVGNSSSSSYVFARLPKDLKSDAAPTTPVGQQIFEGQDYSGTYKIGSGKKFDETGNIVYHDKKNDSVFVREKMLNDYVVFREKMPEIKWQKSPGFQKIAGYDCRKVTASYRGRNYIAWYTDEIAIADGPWKFKGLPGLVLLVEDDRGQVKIYATSVEAVTTEAVTAFVNNGIAVNLAQYVGFRDKELHIQMGEVGNSLQAQTGAESYHLNTRVTTRIGMFGIEKTAR